MENLSRADKRHVPLDCWLDLAEGEEGGGVLLEGLAEGGGIAGGDGLA